MREPEYPDFPAEEYEGRYRRLRAEMDERGIDAILVTNEANHRYFDGFCGQVFSIVHYYFFALFPRDESLGPTFMCAHGFDHVHQTVWLQDIRFWDISPDFYMTKESGGIRMIAEMIKEKGLAEGTIGMEMSSDMHLHMALEHADQLRAMTPDVKWVDSSDAIMEVRAIKSPAEIDKLRKASQISARGVRHGFEQLRPGMTEWELTQIMLARMFELGATGVKYITNYAGPRRMWADAMPCYYQIQKGDLVQFDGGCLVDGYWSDFKRMASIGKPADEDQRYYDIAREGIEAANDAVRAGVPACDLVRAAFDVNRKHGCGEFVDWCHSYGWQAIGHGIGLEVHERPGLAARSDKPVEAGMVMCVEPFVTLGGVHPFWEAEGKFGLEDTMVVTEQGREIFTAEEIISHDLMIV